METQLINLIRTMPNTGLIGDDAAVIGDRIITVDMLTEGVDFLLDEVPPQWVGRKALAVNLSDIAAMAGIPRWIFIAVALPKNGAFELAEQLFAGMKPLIEKYDLILAGGDTNSWDGKLVISITAIGSVMDRGVFRRSGGKAGDRILVTGKLGGSILRHQFFFEPRIEEALYLNEHFDIHAAIDISDGLTLDLHRLAAESQLGGIILESAVPIAEDAFTLSKQSGRTPLEHALSDGEDFELLLTVSPQEAERILALQPFQISSPTQSSGVTQTSGTTIYDIGMLTDQQGLLMQSANGTTKPLTPKGFLH